MEHRGVRHNRALLTCLVAGIALTVGGLSARAQSPAEIQEPPGLPGGRFQLGPSLGASGALGLGETPGQSTQPLGLRPGPSVSRAPVGGLTIPTTTPLEPPPRFRPPEIEAAQVPQYGDLSEPGAPEAPGPPEGLDLDQAIGVLMGRNLALAALRFEIPMARADVLTAGLRSNPILYADSQFVPYGHFSYARTGGPRQYDVNVTIPIDVTRKRVARRAVAEQASRATEAQFQDAIRLQIDNLYTVFVDVVAARETLRFSQAYREGIERLLDLNTQLLSRGQIKPADVDALRAQAEQAQLQVREAQDALVTTTLEMAVLLNIPRAQAEALQIQGTLRDARELPMPLESLIERALVGRPDLVAYRFGLRRAEAETRLARANRYPDVYLLYQPYTLQDNTPYGLKSPTSWAVGLTATMPLFNRNQGNIQRAALNHRQTQVEVADLERRIAHEVEAATREFLLSLKSLQEYEREILPASRRVRDTAYRQFQGGETNAQAYLEAQRSYNEVVRQYRDALVRHRRAMLNLNTAVGERVLP